MNSDKMFTATLPKREGNNRNEQTNEQHKRRQKTTSLTKTIKRWVLNTQANTHTPIIQTHGKSKVFKRRRKKKHSIQWAKQMRRKETDYEKESIYGEFQPKVVDKQC